MKGSAVSRFKPVARIEGQEINFCSLRELCRLVHQEPTVVNMGLESHAEEDTIAGLVHSPSKFVLTFAYPLSAAHRLRGIAANSSTTGTALPFLVRSIVLM